MIVVVFREFERFGDGAAGDVSGGGLVVCNAADIGVEGDFLDGETEFGKVGIEGKLGDAGDAFRVGIDEAAIATLSVERAHSPDTKPLEPNDSRNAFARLDDKTRRCAREEDGAVSPDVGAGSEGHEARLLGCVVLSCLDGTLRERLVRRLFEDECLGEGELHAFWLITEGFVDCEVVGRVTELEGQYIPLEEDFRRDLR